MKANRTILDTTRKNASLELTARAPQCEMTMRLGQFECEAYREQECHTLTNHFSLFTNH